jgi:hypothetical protein
MGTDMVICVEEQWGATGGHVTGTDVAGGFLNMLCDLACSFCYLIG